VWAASALRNSCPVAGGAHRRVLAAQRSWIEAGAVRVESPAAGSRVAGEAVALRMAGDTALQILACRLTVIQQEGLLGVGDTRGLQAGRARPGPAAGSPARCQGRGCDRRRSSPGLRAVRIEAPSPRRSGTSGSRANRFANSLLIPSSLSRPAPWCR
jgi:hypothetical protein